MYDLNNGKQNTKSNKIRKASLLIQYVVKKIYQSEKICRMLYYNTRNPLANIGLSYDGKEIEQTSIDLNSIKPYIYDVGFNPEIIIESTSQLFINIPKGRFRGTQNKLNIEMNIVVPETFSKISNGYRHFEIAQAIADIFDDTYIDYKDLIDYQNLGALKFELTDFSNGRLSKNENYVWLSMLFEVDLLGGQYRAKIGV